MEPVLQNSRRKPRPWTPQDQLTAEVAAACGVTFVSIGKAINRNPSMVRLKVLSASAGASNLAYQQRWKEANRQHVLEKGRLYAQANKTAKIAYDKERYQINRQSFLERARRYRAENPEQVSLCKQNWYKVNRHVVAANSRRWRVGNRARLREIIRRRKALKRSGRRISCNPLTLESKTIRFALWDMCCAYCGTVGKMTVDHVLPLVAGGLDEPANVIPACSLCNCSKRDKPVESWYRSQPFFTEPRWRKIQQHCPSAVVGQLPLSMAV
jgi:5-methylcytosine-specific restriction endonuclease McrA